MSDPRHTQLDWDLTGTSAALQAIAPGIGLEVWGSLDSTNTQLLERLRNGNLSQPTWLVAEHQTAGRGRLGRAWEAPAGAALCASLAWPLNAPDWSGLSLVMGVAAAQALEPGPEQPPQIGLKWPNDLWLRQPDSPSGFGKLAGILIESVVVAGQRWAVIGMGVNVIPVKVSSAFNTACLGDLNAAFLPWTAPRALDTLAPALTLAVQHFERGGFPPWRPAYAARDLLRGRAVQTTAASCPQGVVEGVDGTGALLLRDAQGRSHRVSSGEVSVRPHPAGL